MKTMFNKFFLYKEVLTLIIVAVIFLVMAVYYNYNENKWEDAIPGIESLEGVWIETEFESYEVGTLNVRVKWGNTLDDEILFGEDFCLEKEVSNVWKRVSKKSDINYGFNAIGYILNSNDTSWHKYYLTPYTEGLTSGRYRLNATFSRRTLNGEDYGAGNYPRYQVYGYFDVK